MQDESPGAIPGLGGGCRHPARQWHSGDMGLLPKKGCCESGRAGCSWSRAITHVALLTHQRSSHFQQGLVMGGRGQGGEEELSPASPAVAGGDRDDV